MPSIASKIAFLMPAPHDATNTFQHWRLDDSSHRVADFRTLSYECRASNANVGTCSSFCRGIKLGETISPKLFTLAIEGVFKKLELSEYGVFIGSRRLTDLRYAGNIVLFAHDAEHLERMIHRIPIDINSLGLHTINPESSGPTGYPILREP
ncbi:hypothetical protein HUJ05_003369 [Dendroctonus ponderosae]|nr:hypothetical protein HUJ05_003369 [Dendroctonus ponderosae]